MTIVEMMVNMDCHGCERKVRKALRNMNGVESIDIDMNLQKVTVSGWIDQDKVLRKVRRTGKKAELWQFPNNQEANNGYMPEYADMYAYHRDPATYFNSQQPADIYNYYEHGSNGYQHVTSYQQLPYSTGVAQRATIAFSDENVNACSIM